MKIIKLIIPIILVLNVATFTKMLLTEKITNIENYNPIMAPIVVKAYFSKVIDPAKDSQKLYKDCIDLISEDSRLDQQKRILWNKLSKTLEFADKKGKFGIKAAKNFLKTSNLKLNINGSRVECGSYLKTLLFDVEDFKDPKFQNSLRSEIERVIGVYNEGAKKKGDRIITHFIGDRRSKFVNKDFFKKLNGNK